MLCDVSVYMGESRLADVYCEDCGLKMTKEVSDAVHSHAGPSPGPVVAGRATGSDSCPGLHADTGTDDGTAIATGGGMNVSAITSDARDGATSTAGGVTTAATTSGTTAGIAINDDRMVNSSTKKPPTSPLLSSTPTSFSPPTGGIFSPPTLPFPLPSPPLFPLGNPYPPALSLISHHHHHQDHPQSSHHPLQDHHNQKHMDHHRIWPCCHVDWRARRLNLTSKNHLPR